MVNEWYIRIFAGVVSYSNWLIYHKHHKFIIIVHNLINACYYYYIFNAPFYAKRMYYVCVMSLINPSTPNNIQIISSEIKCHLTDSKGFVSITLSISDLDCITMSKTIPLNTRKKQIGNTKLCLHSLNSHLSEFDPKNWLIDKIS